MDSKRKGGAACKGHARETRVSGKPTGRMELEAEPRKAKDASVQQNKQKCGICEKFVSARRGRRSKS
eukprot:scaffold776_cov347-Pavlova_lutheri.AAC.89